MVAVRYKFTSIFYTFKGTKPKKDNTEPLTNLLFNNNKKKEEETRIIIIYNGVFVIITTVCHFFSFINFIIPIVNININIASSFIFVVVI